MRPTRWVLLTFLIGSSGMAFAEAGAPSARTDPVAERRPWTAESDQAFAEFGYSVGTAGDVNGDGYDDVIVGAIWYDNGQVDEGRALVYHGSARGPSTTPDWTAESDQRSAWFGWSVGTAGDVNGDGFDDVIVGASSYDNGQYNEGRAFVYHGSTSGLNITPDWTAESDQISAECSSVATAGDVNGDGYDDVIVGACCYDNGQRDEGRAFVYHGSARGLNATPDWTAESDRLDAGFGVSARTAGDVNGDGFADVIVGAPEYSDGGQFEEGRAFVYHGSASGLSKTLDWTAEPDDGFSDFGSSVDTAGDVNGDGYADVIVGAHWYGTGGQSFVYHGSAGGLSLAPDWTVGIDRLYAEFGQSVGTAGDVDGDGYADVIVGSPFYYDYGQRQRKGLASLFRGSVGGLSTRPDWRAEPDQASANFGHSVGMAGDVNGDGYSDVIVGAPWFDHGQADEGRAFVYSGKGQAV